MVTAWRGGATALNERLTVLGTPRSVVAGAAGTVLATAADGTPVVVTALPVLYPAAAMDVARRLAALERSLGPRSAATSNGRAIMICSEPPSVQAWRALLVQLGPRGADVYVKQGRSMQRLEAPLEPAARGFRLPGPGEWSLTDWVAAGALLAGLLLTVLGVRGMLG